mgnify:CR=1 FL=1
MPSQSVRCSMTSRIASGTRSSASAGRQPPLPDVAGAVLSQPAQGAPDHGEARGAVVDAGVVAPRYHELPGDILARRGELAAAREEYSLALSGSGAGIVDPDVVRMKLDALGGTADAAETGDS